MQLVHGITSFKNLNQKCKKTPLLKKPLFNFKFTKYQGEDNP